MLDSLMEHLSLRVLLAASVIFVLRRFLQVLPDRTIRPVDPSVRPLSLCRTDTQSTFTVSLSLTLTPVRPELRFSRSPLAPPIVVLLEHIVVPFIEGPVAALSWLALVPRNLDETVVKAEVVTDRVLPTLLVVVVIWKSFHDVLVDAVQGDLPIGGAVDGHGD